MFCSGCGKVLTEGAAFCGACGAPVNNGAAEFVESIKTDTVQSIETDPEIAAADIQTPAVDDVKQQEANGEQAPPVATEQPRFASNEQLPKFFGDQPVQTGEEPQEETSAEVVEEAPKEKGDGVLKGVLATVYCVLIFIFMTISIGLLTTKCTISSENLKDVVGKLDSTTVESLMVEYNLVTDNNIDDYKDVIKETFSDSTIPKFIGEKLGEYGDYVQGGSKPEKIRLKDISGLFEKNRSVAKLLFNFDAQDGHDERYQRYELYYESSIEPALKGFYDNENINKAMDASRIVLSIWVLIGMALITAALVAVLIKFKLKRGRFLNWLGWTFTVSGGLYLLAYVTALVAKAFIGKWGEGTKELIGIVLGSIAAEVVIIGGVLLLAGILMIVIKKMISKRTPKA